MDHPTHWTRPPPQDERLYQYFTGNDLAPPSMHGAFEHMAATSFARGVPDPDGRLVNTGKVGFRQRDELDLLERGNDDRGRGERVSNAQKHRETAAVLAALEPAHVAVLRLAYGPQDQVPALKLGADPQARAKLDGGGAEARGEREKTKRLGAWRQLLPETRAAREAFAAWVSDEEKKGKRSVGVCVWLVRHAPEKALSAARVEAHQLVVVAWNTWADARGRRRPYPKSTFEREAVTPWK